MELAFLIFLFVYRLFKEEIDQAAACLGSRSK